TFPDHLLDLKRVVKWIREEIHNYGGDPDFIVATGGSAGGHLSSLLTLTANDPAYQPGFENVDTSLDPRPPGPSRVARRASEDGSQEESRDRSGCVPASIADASHP
ncbi:MAG: alpha/beta hydrolase, partial [Deltaproteobacteria bacterium]|nr:alpha/beta hydrolase [Deltaproteobacteria bacterium]